MHLPQPISRHMRVNLGGADAGVAEQFLNHAQVRAVFEQVRREAVPEHVRGHVAFDAGAAEAPLHAQPERHRRERRAAFGQENIRG